MVEVGGVVSVDAVAAVRAGLQRRRLDAHVGEQVDGRLLHARRSAPGAGPSRRVVASSRPHDHCTVPAPNTSAPLACR